MQSMLTAGQRLDCVRWQIAHAPQRCAAATTLVRLPAHIPPVAPGCLRPEFIRLSSIDCTTRRHGSSAPGLWRRACPPPAAPGCAGAAAAPGTRRRGGRGPGGGGAASLQRAKTGWGCDPAAATPPPPPRSPAPAARTPRPARGHMVECGLMGPQSERGARVHSGRRAASAQHRDPAQAAEHLIPAFKHQKPATAQSS